MHLNLNSMKIISWQEFDCCIEHIIYTCGSKSFSGVYGFPRGGLCLGVALSHSLKIPLLEKPMPGALVVDDVYETGKTLAKVAEMKDITTFVWFSKVKPQWWNAVNMADPKVWLVFPWEDKSFAMEDKKNYQASILNSNA